MIKSYKIGFCYKHLKHQKQFSPVCDNFECNKQNEINRKEKLLIALEKSLSSINCIADILVSDEL